MAATSIEWTNHSWNFLAGCNIVSPGCTNCYAMRQAARIERMNPALAHYQGLTQPSKAGPVWTGKVAYAGDEKLTEPLRVKKPAMWFVNSMSDLFHESVPDAVIDKAFAVMALAPQHIFQVLTKRSARMRAYLERIGREFHGSPDDLNERFGEHCAQLSGDPCAAGWFEDEVNWPLPNVWLGVSVENQRQADERIPDLLATPAAVRWISAEPLLSKVDLSGYLWGRASGNTCTDCPRDCDCECGVIPRHNLEGEPALSWIVAGGESGPGARPMHPAWARSLRDQCAAAGVPYFFKQWGAWAPCQANDGTWPTDAPRLCRLSLDGSRAEDGWPMQRVGKTRAGRHLDGITHDAFPQVRL